MLEMLENLKLDPESYWIMYDLYLENNWAFDGNDQFVDKLIRPGRAYFLTISVSGLRWYSSMGYRSRSGFSERGISNVGSYKFSGLS
jgi:hypothetical protein